MYFTLNRRRFLQATSALAVAGFASKPQSIAFEDIPRGSFGATSTADEVAAGIDLIGQTALITGCNSGLGYETMKTLAANGAHVIGAARTMEKAQSACESVDGKTTPVVCELTDFANVAACADTVVAMDEPLDMLFCNAGIMALPKLEQVNGIEKQFVVNHLGHYILTRRLLKQVEAAPQGRVIIVSSVGYRNAPKAGIEFDNLSGERNYSPFKMYGQTKLANALFSRSLAEMYAGTSVTSNAVHPGIVRTNLGRYFMPPGSENRPMRPDMKTADQGAATQVYVGVHPNITGVSGFYFEDCNPVQPEGPHMEDAALAQKLWDVSEEMVREYL